MRISSAYTALYHACSLIHRHNFLAMAAAFCQLKPVIILYISLQLDIRASWVIRMHYLGC